MILLVAIVMMTLACAGLTYVLLTTLQSAAETYAEVYARKTSSAFEDLFLFIPAQRMAALAAGCAVFVFVVVFVVGGGFRSLPHAGRAFVAGLVVAVPVLWLPGLFLKVLKARRLKKFNVQLVDALTGMSNALKAGFSITQSFEAIARDGENPIAQEFDAFLQQTRVGVSFSDALNNLQTRVGSADLTLVCLAVETARQTGGNLTGIFEQIAATIRERFRIENRIQTLTAQGRLQGIVVGAMPLIIGLALLIVDPAMMVPFLQSATGLMVMALVAVLLLCGAMMIRRIVRIDV